MNLLSILKDTKRTSPPLSASVSNVLNQEEPRHEWPLQEEYSYGTPEHNSIEKEDLAFYASQSEYFYYVDTNLKRAIKLV